MNRMGRKSEMHRVDGQEMTAVEIAEMLGITLNALRMRRSRMGGISMQAVVNMYRANQFGSDRDRAARYMVEGKWMTRAQIAETLGILPGSLTSWICANKATMDEAVAHFRRWNEEGRKRNPLGLGGRIATRYPVGNRTYTVREVAEKYGVAVMTVRGMLKSRGGDMGKVLAFYQAKARKRQKRAEKEIMRILGY